MDQLVGQLQSFWDAPSRTIRSGGQESTPAQALAILRTGRIKPGTPEYDRLALVADGSTVLGAHKRFDGILVSRDAEVRSAYIDQDTRASDHQPVLAEVRL